MRRPRSRTAARRAGRRRRACRPRSRRRTRSSAARCGDGVGGEALAGAAGVEPQPGGRRIVAARVVDRDRAPAPRRDPGRRAARRARPPARRRAARLGVARGSRCSPAASSAPTSVGSTSPPVRSAAHSAGRARRRAGALTRAPRGARVGVELRELAVRTETRQAGVEPGEPALGVGGLLGGALGPSRLRRTSQPIQLNVPSWSSVMTIGSGRAPVRARGAGAGAEAAAEDPDDVAAGAARTRERPTAPVRPRRPRPPA